MSSCSAGWGHICSFRACARRWAGAPASSVDAQRSGGRRCGDIPVHLRGIHRAGHARHPGRAAPDIYQWLPFSQADLAKAASVTEAFGSAYDTFSYRDATSSYAARFRGLATSELSSTLARAYGTPGIASQRTAQQQVSSARTVINSIRTFSSGSLTFVVTIVQTMHTKQGTSRSTGHYAITLTGSGQSWLASDIELASAGNS